MGLTLMIQTRLLHAVPWSLVHGSPPADVQVLRVSGLSSSLHVRQLRPYSAYKARIAASNDLGQGPFGQTATVSCSSRHSEGLMTKN